MRTFVITVNGNSYEVNVDEVKEGQVVAAPVKKENVPASTAAAPAAAGEGTPVKAPMPGTVMEVKVKVGDKVNKDDVLLTMEAMKMENAISAPVSGTVTAVAVSKGASVNTGDLLITIG